MGITIKPCGSSNGGFRRIVAPFPKLPLFVGDRDGHFLWDVRGVTDNFVVLTQHAQFHETGVLRELQSVALASTGGCSHDHSGD